MAQDSSCQKFELALRPGPSQERISNLFARARQAGNPSPTLAKKSLCALILFCDIQEQKPQDNVISKYSIGPGMEQFVKNQARKRARPAAGRHYLLLYSKSERRLAGPAGEARPGESPQDAVSRISRENLKLTDTEAKEIAFVHSLSEEKADLSVFTLSLPYERLVEMIIAVNSTGPKSPAMEDFFFAALVRARDFEGENMSGVYQGKFMGIMGSVELLRKQI